MVLDHVGKVFFPDIAIFIIIGRFAFPIFAYFIAEGFYFTRNRKKYFLKILIFAIISQIPYLFLFDGLNILFTFFVSIILLFIVDMLFKTRGFQKFILIVITVLILILSYLLGLLGIIDYGLYGVLLPIIFYLFRDGDFVKFSLFIIMVILGVVGEILLVGSALFINFIPLFSILSVPVLLLYNENFKNSKVFKYLFYILYPLHLAFILLIKVIIF